jgi:hypothetical protein
MMVSRADWVAAADMRQEFETADQGSFGWDYSSLAGRLEET